MRRPNPESGDKLFLHPDGLPAMPDALNGGETGTPEETPDKTGMCANAPAGDVPQPDDDLTMCMEQKTKDGDAKLLTVAADKDNLNRVVAFVDAFLERHGCPMKAQMQIDLCVEEIFVNIANYAYPGKTGDAEIRLAETDGTVTLIFTDRGKPYNPLKRRDPDITLSAKDRQIGGLGIFLVKRSMDAVSYRYEDGKNILTLTKHLSGKE